jgi:hypothetical protein
MLLAATDEVHVNAVSSYLSRPTVQQGASISKGKLFV